MRHDELAAVLRFDDVFQGFRRFRCLDTILVINDTVQNVAVAGAKDRVDGIPGKPFQRRRFVFGEGAFLAIKCI